MRGRTKYSFATLLHDHEELNTLFENHQRALLSKDIGRANSALIGFRRLLDEHIRLEEESILPLFVAKHAESPGATRQLFQAEHRKITEIADKLANETLKLSAAADLDRCVIDLMDQEALFKSLLSHHTLREQNGLFPKLDSCTTQKERSSVLRKSTSV